MPVAEQGQTEGIAETPGEITALLREWAGGDADALDKLYPMVLQKLRRAASHYLNGESSQTLGPTALVNETYLELINSKNLRFENRHQFFLLAGSVMRHLLVNRARRRLAQKRGGGETPFPLNEDSHGQNGDRLTPEDLLALDRALTRLAELDRRQAMIVQLRFFAGLSEEEIAAVLKVSTRTIQREWNTAKRWLSRELTS